MRLMAEGHGARRAGTACALLAALALAGCGVGEEGTYSPDSLTCSAAQTLFGGSAGYDEQVVRRLVAGVPDELRATAERLASFPESVDEWQRYDADLARMQQWAVVACGTTVAFPVEFDDTPPRLDEHLISLSRDGDTLSVIVSGADSLESATELCEQALHEHALPGRGLTLEVRDSFGITLAIFDGEGCVISPELGG